jgi:hypothetical protein
MSDRSVVLLVFGVTVALLLGLALYGYLSGAWEQSRAAFMRDWPFRLGASPAMRATHPTGDGQKPLYGLPTGLVGLSTENQD